MHHLKMTHTKAYHLQTDLTSLVQLLSCDITFILIIIINYFDQKFVSSNIAL